jgi:hypothetical protein
MIDLIQITKLSDSELEGLRSLVEGERAKRAQSASDAPVCYQLSIHAGNARAGAKGWAKELTAIEPSKPNGFGLEGPWAPRNGALASGTYLVLGGKGGSWKNSTAAYVLIRVKRGAAFSHEAGYQSFSGSGAELVATSGDELNEQAVLDRHPDLARCVGQPLFSIYAALRAAGF